MQIRVFATLRMVDLRIKIRRGQVDRLDNIVCHYLDNAFFGGHDIRVCVFD